MKDKQVKLLLNNACDGLGRKKNMSPVIHPLIFLFALQLKWLPATGYSPLSEGIRQNLHTFLLPSLSIALIEWVPLMRVLRTDMIITLRLHREQPEA